MIAATLAFRIENPAHPPVRSRGCTLRFHSVDMTNFLLDLFSNLTLLVIVLVLCFVCNRLIPHATLNGWNVFAALMLLALLFDAALTFLVFADSQTRYGQFSTPHAFFQRATAYVVAASIALVCCQIMHRRRPERTRARESLVIPTSPYSESHLPM